MTSSVRRAPGAFTFVLVAMLGLVMPNPAHAAGDEQDAASPRKPRPTPDFLFGQPRGTVGVRGSWVFARAGSDLFAFVQDQLTIDKGAFNAPGVAIDVGVSLTDRVDVVVGYDYSRAAMPSEYRDFVDNSLLPIEQRTSLQSSGFSGSLKVALTPRGRSIGRFAWIPRAATPYVGGGGGILWYEFKQYGDFVDFADLSVFGDVFRASGLTPTAHVFGGLDVKLLRHVGATIEGRYLWAAGKLSSDFVDFDPIDLAGFRMSAGVQFVF